MNSNGYDKSKYSNLYFHHIDSRTSLKQLITQQNNKAHDNERWELLKWVFGMDKGFLDSVRKIPYNNKQRVMTIALHFLLEVSTATTVLHFVQFY